MKLADPSTAEQTEAQAAWVLRRGGFGATVADLGRARSIGLNQFLDELFHSAAERYLAEMERLSATLDYLIDSLLGTASHLADSSANGPDTMA